MWVKTFASLAAMGLMLLPAVVRAQATPGNPKLQSIEAMAFTPDGRLLIGDGKGAQVIAISVNSPDGVQRTQWAKTEVSDVKTKVAGLLKTPALEFGRLVVDPVSHQAYLAVRKGENKEDAIVVIGGDGSLRELDLNKARYQRFSLGEDARAGAIKIGDLTFAEGRVLLAVLNKEKGGNTIYTIDTQSPDGAPAWEAAETYHIGHGRWETGAPLRTVMPYREGGKTFLVGAFTCTPIVKYSLEDLKASGGKVQGKSVVELGTGNTPQDMFVYEKGDRSFILMNNVRNNGKPAPGYPNPYWTAKIEQGILAETEQVNEKAPWRIAGKGNAPTTNRAVMVPEFEGVVTMDRLGNDHALVLRSDAKGTLQLTALPLP